MTNKTFAQFGFKMSHIELLKIGTSLAQDEEFLPKHMSALSLVYIFHHSYLFGDIFQSYTQDGPGHIRRTPSIFQAALLPYWLMGIKSPPVQRAVEGSGVDGNELFQQSDDPSWCSQRFYTLFCCTNNQMKGYRLYYIKKTRIE